MSEIDKFSQEIRRFKKHGGILRTVDAIRLGIQTRSLRAMNDQGKIEVLGRGLYRLSDMPPLTNPDLVVSALKIPNGVICLISALAFHGITLQIPHEVDISLCRGTERPRIHYPPMHYVWMSGHSFSKGIETHKVDGVDVKIYSPEKTVADCFKFRSKVGLNVALEALKLCREKKHSKPSTLMEYAKICRVEKIMQPYLEALL